MLTLNSTHTTPNRSNILDRPQVIYYQLNGKNDTVRYVWSLVGLPTLFVSVTGPGDSCTKSANESFDWKDFVANQSEGSAHIPGFDGDFAFSIVFRNVIEFKDRRNKGERDFNIYRLNDNKTYNIVSLSNLTWTYQHSQGLLKGQSNVANSSFEIDIRVGLSILK